MSAGAIVAGSLLWFAGGIAVGMIVRDSVAYWRSMR